MGRRAMHHALLGSLALVAVVAFAASAAEGEGPGSVYPVEEYPTRLVKRPLTLSAGMFEVRLPFQLDLSSGSAGKSVTFNIPASVSYGVTPDIQVDVFTGTGFCLGGDANGCPRLLDDVGARAVASLLRDYAYQLVASAGIDILKISDPSAVAAQVALAGKWSAGFFGLDVRALLNVGLNNRDAPVNVREVLAPPNVGPSGRSLGNKEVLAVAVQPQFQLGRLFAAYAIAGLAGRLDAFGDSFAVPLGAGLMYVANPFIDVGAEFAFDNLAGKNSTADARSGRAFANLRY